MCCKHDEPTETLPLLHSAVPTDEPPKRATNLQASATNKKRENLGRVLQATAAFCFAICDVSTRYQQTRLSMRPEQVVFLVGTTNMLCALLYLTTAVSIREVFRAFRRTDFVMLGLRGACGVLSFFSVVVAFQYIPSGDTMALVFSGPVMLIFLSCLLLKEPVTKPALAAAVIGFAGVVILSLRDDGGATAAVSPHDRTIGTTVALFGALATCFVYLTVRMLVTSVHFMTSTLAFGFTSMCSSAVLGGYTTPSDFRAQPLGVGMAVCTGLLVFCAQCCVSYGLQFCSASTAYMLRNLEVLFVYVLGLVFLHEVPTPLHAFGAMLVVCGAIVAGVTKARNAGDTPPSNA